MRNAICAGRAAPATVKLRHHLECLPTRRAPKPKWEPSGLSKERDTRPISVVGKPQLIAASDLGPVRTNFRYAGRQGVSASYSEKAGRTQYFEGPNEAFGFRLHEMDPYYVDLQYQPLALAWKSLDGSSNRIVFDYAVETEDGQIILGEDKASEAFFSDPPLKTRLDFAEEVLRQYGVKLERRTAGGLPSALERRVVKDHFDARLTRFSEHDADRIQNLIRERGGTVLLGALLQALGTCPNLGLLMASAMMLRRKIAMPLSSPPMLSTPITIPRPANKGALRAFLARFAQTPTVSKGRRRA